MEEEGIKRGLGKIIGDIRKHDFWLHYQKHAKEGKQTKLAMKDKHGNHIVRSKILNRDQYKKFLTEILQTYSEAIVKEGFQLKIKHIGVIQIRTKELTLLDSKGKLHEGLMVDWKKTWEYWRSKYPGLTRQEILDLPEKKTTIRFTNEHTGNEYYVHYWKKTDCYTDNLKLYKFTPARQFSRLIAQVVKAPERKVFYYKKQ